MDLFLLLTIKLIIGFLALTLIINITGKGNLAPSSASDQIINYVLGGIIGGVIYNNNITILEFVAILCIWCALVLSLKYGVVTNEMREEFKEWIKKNNVTTKQLIDGKALTIINEGKINIENCKKAGLSAHDVAFKLRTNGIFSSDGIKRAIVEQNGQLIIIHSGEENPKFPIITDGQLQNDILKLIGKDEKWLLAELKKQGVDKYSDVFLGEYVDKKLKLTTYK